MNNQAYLKIIFSMLTVIGLYWFIDMLCPVFIFDVVTLVSERVFARLVMTLFFLISTYMIVRLTKKTIEQNQGLDDRDDKLSEVFDNLKSGVAVYRPVNKGSDFIFVDFNAGCERIEGVKKEQVLNKSVLSVFPGVVHLGLYDIMKEVNDTGVSQGHVSTLEKDGKMCWRENYICKLPSGLLVAVYDDITEERYYEEKLKKTFSSVADGILTLSPDMKITMMNSAAEKILDAVEDDALFHSLDFIFGESGLMIGDIPLTTVIKEVIDNRITKSIPEIIYNTKSGERRILEDSISPITDGDDVIGVVIVFRDITQNLIIEQKNRELESQLAHSSKMEAVGHLSGGIAHDFNNYLTSINGHVEIIESDISKDVCDEPNLISNLEKIKLSSKKAAILTKKLMTFNKNQFIDLKVIDVNETINTFMYLIVKSLGEDVTIETKLNADKNIYADSSQIEQILLNLSFNARDAMNSKRASGKNITIETSTVTMSNSHYIDVSDGEYIHLKFSDTGTGIKKQFLDKIFDPFFTTKKNGRGTGLGLSSVYGIIKQNQGAIYVDSSSKGTTFNIYWPVKGGKKSATEAAKDKKKVNGNETILFVEDNHHILDMVLEYLTSFGYKIISAENGVEGLKLLSPDIDLIVTDVVMPEMGGYEFIEKAKQKMPDVKVLYTSGYTDNADVLNREVEFIEKPYSLIDMLGEIRRILTQ